MGRLAVVGSRNFTDFDKLVKILDNLSKNKDISSIISGGAKGTDSMAEHYAEVNNIPTEIFPAEWGKYGKSAGFIRNQTIWDNSDIILVIWDGESKGTKHTIDAKANLDKEMYILNYKLNKWVDRDGVPL